MASENADKHHRLESSVESKEIEENGAEFEAFDKDLDTPPIQSCLEHGYSKDEVRRAFVEYRHVHGSKRYSGRDLCSIIENLREGNPPFYAEFEDQSESEYGTDIQLNDGNEHQSNDDNVDQSNDGHVDQCNDGDVDQSNDENVDQSNDENENQSNDENADQSKDIKENQSVLDAETIDSNFCINDQYLTADQPGSSTDEKSLTAVKSHSIKDIQSSSVCGGEDPTTCNGAMQITLLDGPGELGEDFSNRVEIPDGTLDDEDGFQLPVCGCYDSDEILAISWNHLYNCPVCAVQILAMPEFYSNFFNSAWKLAWLCRLPSNE